MKTYTSRDVAEQVELDGIEYAVNRFKPNEIENQELARLWASASYTLQEIQKIVDHELDLRDMEDEGNE